MPSCPRFPHTLDDIECADAALCERSCPFFRSQPDGTSGRIPTMPVTVIEIEAAVHRVIERANSMAMPIIVAGQGFCLLHGQRIEPDALCPQCASNAKPMTDEQRRNFLQSAAESVLRVQAETDAAEME